jgi:hypothetical protein
MRVNHVNITCKIKSKWTWHYPCCARTGGCELFWIFQMYLMLLLSRNMWLPFIHKWWRINHSSDPICKLTCSTTWHLLPISLIHLNEKQSCTFSFLQGARLFAPFEMWPASSYQSSDPRFGPSFISTLFYLIWLSTINNSVWKYMFS